MIKVTTHDILAILRRFDVATDEDIQRSIDQIRRVTPDDESITVSFRFKKERYFILFDHRAEDDEAYLLEAVHELEPNVNGFFIQNPLDEMRDISLPFKGKDVYLFKASNGKQRLDKELVDRYPEMTRSTIQKYIKRGDVSVNGEVQTQPRFEVSPEDDISLTQLEKTDYSSHELPILYMDDNMIVVDKPIGVLTHSKGELNDEFTVADFFRRYTTYHLDTNRPGIVHRLDRDTSGVIIGARNPETALLLQKQFAERTTKKTYYAVTNGIPKNDKALIDLPIGRHPSLPSTFRVDPQGKPALTAYEVVAITGACSLVQLRPKTGRTHQLRVHMAYIRTPILGDRIYGEPRDRLYLHAYSLEITIPQGERRVFVSSIPEAFTSLFPGYSEE